MKKTLAFLLSFVMILSLVQTTAFAKDTDLSGNDQEYVQSDEQTDQSTEQANQSTVEALQEGGTTNILNGNEPGIQSETHVHDMNTSETSDDVTFDKTLDSTFTGGSLPTGNYLLTADIDLSEEGKADIIIENNAVVNLCLNGHVIKGSGNGSVITISEGSTFYLHDCGSTTEHKFTVPTGDSKAGLWLWDDTNGTETVKGGVITGGAITSDEAIGAGGITNYGTLIIYGGNIIGCKSTIEGGGIYSAGDTIIIKKSIISGNTSGRNGGGIGIYKATTVTMDEVTVGYNTAGTDGGGIYISPYNPSEDRIDVSASNVTIEGNKASTGGGVFHNCCGKFELKDCTVSNNNSTSISLSN